MSHDSNEGSSSQAKVDVVNSLAVPIGQFSENLVDSLLDDKVVASIPVISTAIGGVKAVRTIQDQIVLKKILSFLHGLDDVPPEKIRKMTERIDASKKYRTSIGEKLLLLIERSKDYEIAELIGKLFNLYINNEITIQDYYEASEVASDLAISDLHAFISRYEVIHELWLENISFHSGLYSISYEEPQVEVRDSSDYKMNKKYDAEVSGGDFWIEASRAGQTIYNAVKS